MSTDITQSIDPIRDSEGGHIVVVFSKYRSNVYPLALSIAKGARKYAELTIEKELVHMALFSFERLDVNKVVTLLSYLSGIKSASVFINGKAYKESYFALAILSCYEKSLSCNDFKAHCFAIIDDPFVEKSMGRLGFSIRFVETMPVNQKPTIIQRYVFPCKHLFSYFRFQLDHPASPEDQVQAAAVEYKCDWCPNFSANNFSKLPKKVIWPDGSVATEPSSLSKNTD